MSVAVQQLAEQHVSTEEILSDLKGDVGKSEFIPLAVSRFLVGSLVCW